jgi:plasmid replication initiation protein
MQEFKTTGYVIKSIAELRHLFQTGTKYKEYKNFKAKCLTHAINEINTQYPTINLSINEIRTNRAVTSIELIFNKTYLIQSINPITKQPKNVQIKPKQIPLIKPKPIEKDQSNVVEPANKPTKPKTEISSLIERLKTKAK